MDRCDYDSKQNFMYVPFQLTIKRCYADGNKKTNQFLLHLYQSQILQSLVSGLSSGIRMMFKLNVSLFPVLASSAAPLMRFISIFPALCTPFQFSLIQQYTSPKKKLSRKNIKYNSIHQLKKTFKKKDQIIFLAVQMWDAKTYISSSHEHFPKICFYSQLKI